MRQDQAILVKNLTKEYHLYQRPVDRLKEIFDPFRRSYHTIFRALNNVSLEVARGETVGVVGRNGAGKSTLLKILSHVVSPTSGSVEVRGRISSLLELGTGFNPELSGLENVFFNGMLLGMSRQDLQDRLEDILAFADIGEFIHHPVKVYSSGMCARLAFAVAFFVEPEVLIVDEALSVGDFSFQKKCYERFRRIRESGCTILFVSHDPYQVRGYCQRAVYLKNGSVAHFGLSSDVMDLYLYDQETKNSERTSPSPAKATGSPTNANILIKEVDLIDANGKSTRSIQSGESVTLTFAYRVIGEATVPLSFVFNLYKHDDTYICGATSIMDNKEAVPCFGDGTVSVVFPTLPLLSGRYKWRVAINDETGLGIYTEAVPVCEFQVTDDFRSVGLVHLNRQWILPHPEIKFQAA